MPIHLKLTRNVEIEEKKAFISKSSEEHREEVQISDIELLIRKYSDELAGTNYGISGNEFINVDIEVFLYINISLMLKGNDLPGLILVDLPGITRVPLADTDQDEDIETLTKELIGSNTLIKISLTRHRAY